MGYGVQAIASREQGLVYRPPLLELNCWLAAAAARTGVREGGWQQQQLIHTFPAPPTLQGPRPPYLP